MKNFMVDLETMGVGPDAAIISIGVVPFDLENRTMGELNNSYSLSINNYLNTHQE